MHETRWGPTGGGPARTVQRAQHHTREVLGHGHHTEARPVCSCKDGQGEEHRQAGRAVATKRRQGEPTKHRLFHQGRSHAHRQQPGNSSDCVKGDPNKRLH